MLTNPVSLVAEVWVDPLLCRGSGVCVAECSMGVFEIVKHKAYPTHADICIGCFKCLEFCPRHAISSRWIMRVA